MSNDGYAVVLVYSTSHALKAEKVIKAAGYDCKLIPVPRHLSSDCGVCVRITAEIAESIAALLGDGGVAYDAIHVL